MKPKRYVQTYTWMDELMASPVHPLEEERRRHQLTRMWSGLASLERDAAPCAEDWRLCSDAVNLLETLITMGAMQDQQGLLADAVAALAEAGKRHQAGQGLRLSAAGIQSVRAVLEDYATALAALPARVVIAAHRRTEKRLQEILSGKRRPHDVEVMDI